MPSPPRRPAVTLTFDLQNLITSLVEASEYFLSVLSQLVETFIRYYGNKICPDEQTDERTRQDNGTTRKHINAFASTIER